MTTNCFLRSFLNIVIFINLSIAWTPHQMIFKLPNIISNIRKSSLKLNMIPRRMPAPKTRNNDIIKKLLIDLIDMENVELAPNLLAPHIEVIMKSNITHACFDLIKDLNLNNESEGYDYVMAASDYITCFINEFEFQKSSITNQHRDILNSIIQVSKNGTRFFIMFYAFPFIIIIIIISFVLFFVLFCFKLKKKKCIFILGTIEEINKVISINSPHYTSSFLTNLRNEIKYLDESSNNVENAALSSLLRTIQCRILNELETLTTADVQVFRAILDTKRKSFSDDIELLTDVVLTTLER